MNPLANEPALVEKKDGENVGPYDATFAGSTIFIWDETADVVEGDVILRNLPNGNTERSTITNATFFKVGPRGPHYQLKFTKGSMDSGIRASSVVLDGVQIIADRMKLVLESENKILEDEIRRITNYNAAKGKAKSGQTLIEVKAATIQIVEDRRDRYVEMLDETALDWSGDLSEVLQKQVEILFSDHLGDLEAQLGKLYKLVGSQAGANKVHDELIGDIRRLRNDLHLQLENKRIEPTHKGDKIQRPERTQMKVFLSWSSPASHAIACLLRDWLQTVLPQTVAWVSSIDIDKGARWSAEIATELVNSNFGIICVVPGNLRQPWLNFEAGALSNSLGDNVRVAPLLVGLEKSDVEGPLAQFQLTVFRKDDVYELLKSLNRAYDNPLSGERLVKNFDNCWDKLNADISKIDISENTESRQEVRRQVGRDELNDKQVKILILLAEHEDEELEVDVIANEIDENKTRTKHFLTLLRDGNYVFEGWSGDGGLFYAIDDKGRAYLVEHNLDEDY